MEFFSEYKTVFIIFHLVGLALGLGGALVSDYLFFRFLKDLKLSKQELYVMGLMSGVVWAGLFLLILSGIFIFLSNPVGYMASSKFLLKMLVVLALTLNGCLLHFYIKPRLKLIDWAAGLKDKHRKIRRVAFGAGAVSVTSWLLATVLGSLSSIPFEIFEAAGLYAILLLIAVLTSQVIEHLLFSN